MANLMHDRRCHISLRARLRRLLRIHDALGKRQNYVVHTRIHVVLEEDLFRSLLLVNAWIVREVISDSLIAVTQVSAAKWRVEDLHRRGLTSLGWTVFWRERQCVLNLRHVLLICCELRALRFIADHHGRAI